MKRNQHSVQLLLSHLLSVPFEQPPTDQFTNDFDIGREVQHVRQQTPAQRTATLQIGRLGIFELFELLLAPVLDSLPPLGKFLLELFPHLQQPRVFGIRRNLVELFLSA